MKKYIIACLLIIGPGIYAFNQHDLQQLQETCSCEGCDLTNANLEGFKLGDVRTFNKDKAKHNNGLAECNLDKANFSGANLKNAYFSLGDFAPGVDQTVGKVLLRRANFSRANLTGAHFNAVVADNSKFQYANLTKLTILKGASFKQVDFSHAQMAHSSVSATMGGCGADFSESNFTATNLKGSRVNANFTAANFTRANLADTALEPCDNDLKTSFIQTNFTDANLTHATSLNTVITESTLANARLCRTKLTGGVSNRDCTADGHIE